eukprot:gene36139-46987_t
MLANTFKAPDLTGALGKVLKPPHALSDTRELLSHSEEESAAAAYGIKPNKPYISPKPVGLGSGAVFDAGAEYISTLHRKQHMTNMKTRTNSKMMKMSLLSQDMNNVTGNSTGSNEMEGEGGGEGSRIVEGVTIPKKLDGTAAVNFILTQEPGKLKPKDLKVAIDKAKTLRERRTADQQTIRSLGGGGLDGALDLNGLLAEERINLEEGNAYKRQLRELAFLADVEAVRKRESEKDFRVSEEFLGVDPITLEEVGLVLEQRKETAKFLKK